MAKVKNFLFIMCDQLRADYLSCYGHPSLHTANIDALAKRGVIFSRAYCSSPICGPSRMSFYTGRHMVSHGATWNHIPLSVGEWTLGDYMRQQGVRTALVGKTHMAADPEGMQRLGIDPVSELGVLVSQCGFEPYERDDGLHPNKLVDPKLAYNDFLRQLGYGGDNPWNDYANSAEGPGGELLSGWYLRNSHLPARIDEAHSETPYMTNRAMDFMTEAGDTAWCLHLSYIKPHWPYMAPAPYHNMYGQNHVPPAVKSEAERVNPHPVYGAFMEHEDSENFANDAVRLNVIPTYMGLIKQIDDHLGRLFRFMDDHGLMDNTMVVFTSDHGDYLGDHWLGEKDLFHEPSARIPFILYDPDAAADHSRGTVDARFVEATDLVPTFIDATGGPDYSHRIDGRSLLPLTRQPRRDVVWRDFAVCEVEYSLRGARAALGVTPHLARGYMLRTDDWKYILWEGFRPQLFNLKNDPNELTDLGADPAQTAIRAELHERVFTWLRQRPIRVTASENTIKRRGGAEPNQEGKIIIGRW